MSVDVIFCSLIAVTLSYIAGGFVVHVCLQCPMKHKNHIKQFDSPALPITSLSQFVAEDISLSAKAFEVKGIRELKAIALQLGIVNYSRMNKATLVLAVYNHET
jgi:hypothetical protein